MKGDVKFTGRLRISRIYSNSQDDYISLELRDEKSGVQMLDLEMTLPDFATAMFGQERPCSGRLRGIERVNTTSEHKSEFVPGERDYKDREGSEARAVAPFEVDGWSARSGDFGNSHRGATKDGVKGYHVTFTRHVRDDGTPVL